MEASTSQSIEGFSIENLPEEVLEFILSFIPPYKDLHDCMQVSKKWRQCVLNVVKTKQRNFQKAINDFDVKWTTVTPDEMAPTITKRYSHSAVVCDNSMYVFGGCTSAMTTFNDLWRIDLSKRTWVRPLAMGTYPSPKACSTLVKYNDKLVLFGGWTYPPSYPLYQSWHLFNELHVYDVTANKWFNITTQNSPPPMAGHSASVIGQHMIVFGGLQKPSQAVHCEKSNDVWILDLATWEWYKKEIKGSSILSKPSGRFGQTQVVLDDQNLLILGGSGGPCSQFNDCWRLHMGTEWKWSKVEILGGKDNEPANIWSNPGCKIGDKIVILNRIREDNESKIIYYPRSQWLPPEDSRLNRIDLANRRVDQDENVNGRRGTLRNARVEEEENRPNIGMFEPGSHGDLRFHNPHLSPVLPQMSPPRRYDMDFHLRKLKREIRLERLNTFAAKTLKKEPAPSTSKINEPRHNNLGIFVLDISTVLSETPKATWLPPKNIRSGPEEAILYTLVEGKTELVMFGGILKDANSLVPCDLSSQICNSLHFISAPNYVI